MRAASPPCEHMGRSYRDVVVGQKHPEWRCDRCDLNNFAFRKACRGCDQSSRRAPAGTSKAGEGRGAGAAATALQKEIADLRKQVAELKKKEPKPADKSEDEDAAAGPSLDDLVKFHSVAVATFGPSSEFATSALARLERARKQRDQARPTSVRIRNLERVAERKKKAHESAVEAHDKARKAAESAAAALEEAKRAWGEAERDLAEMRDVQRQESPAAAQPRKWEPSLPPNFEDMPEERKAKAKQALDDLKAWADETPPAAGPEAPRERPPKAEREVAEEAPAPMDEDPDAEAMDEDLDAAEIAREAAAAMDVDLDAAAKRQLEEALAGAIKKQRRG